MEPAAHATHTALYIRPSDNVLKGQLRSQTKDIKHYRLYADFPQAKATKYPQNGGAIVTFTYF